MKREFNCQDEKADWSALVMSEDVFWRIIKLFNWKQQGDDEAVIEPAVAALSQMRVDSIEQFENLLAEKLYSLDTEAHAREIGEGAYLPGQYFSVDWFLYARCAVVANGPDFYAAVLADPKQFPKDMEFEFLLSVGRNAYERRTGREMEYVTPVSYETYSNLDGWPATDASDTR